ncbi:MAG: sigma 54-interacting transcriptional regulator [Planctomycetes bacterium]|nr:sigma 54-interacting transcriptional regulator [Planctomycetota bacterium]
MSNPLLIILGQNNLRRIVSLTEDRITLGRGPTNNIVLPDEKLSRHHCAIRRKKGGDFEIEDLKSLNGTRVNGKTLYKKKKLMFGDTIVIGGTTLIFEAEDSPLLDTQAIEALNEPKAKASTAILTGLETEIPGKDGTSKRGTILGDDDVVAVVTDDYTASLKKKIAGFRKVLNISKKINSELKTETVISAIVDSAIEITGAERGFLILKNKKKTSSAVQSKKDTKTGTFKIEVARNLDKEKITQPTKRISMTLLKRVMEEGSTLLTANAQHEGALSEAQSIQNLSIQSVLCVALKSSDTIIGALYLDHRFHQDAFDPDIIEIVEAFTEQAVITMENARLIEMNVQRQHELEENSKKIEQLNAELQERYEKQTAELAAIRRSGKNKKDTEFISGFPGIIGESPKLLEILRNLEKVAPTDLSVYIQGEPGTGKELIAQALHHNSKRKDMPFVAINCAAFTETLLESELFGHVKGSFTGASEDRTGVFEQPNGGTLFLDEVGEMSQNMQSKLLRVLQDGEFRRVGDKKNRKVDVRIVSASNRDLQEMLKSKDFREDLYYRFVAVKLELAPLRERQEDIPLLVSFFLDKIVDKHEIVKPKINKSALQSILRYSWPGNIRQLENEIKKLVALCDEGKITKDDLSPDITSESKTHAETYAIGNRTLHELVEDLEKKLITEAFEKYGTNKSKVAEILGLSRLGLRKKIERYNLEL